MSDEVNEKFLRVEEALNKRRLEKTSMRFAEKRISRDMLREAEKNTGFTGNKLKETDYLRSVVLKCRY